MISSLAAFAPTRASAYCVNPDHAANWRTQFSSLRIPVYVSIGDNSSVEHTGLAKEDVSRWVQELIARHNETVVAPKLHYAGFSTEGLIPMPDGDPVNSMALWQPGITIYSFGCSSPDIHPAFLCNGDMSILACGYQHVNGSGQRLGLVALRPPTCGSTLQWSVDGSTPNDLAHAILHEIGHVLGLGHTNVPASECHSVHGNDRAGNTGVMRTTNGASLSAHRHWRRDDIDGLDHLYAADAPDYELALWHDESFPAEPKLGVATSMVGTSVIRSGRLASTAAATEQPVVSVDVNRRVIMASFAPDATILQPPVVVDPSPRGVTVGSPDIALGSDGTGERVFVTWTAGEQPNSEELQPRWAIRDLAGGTWTTFDGPTQRTSRLSAGFDPATRSWLLGTHSSTGEVLMSIVDYDGVIVLDAAQLRVQAFEFGNPICSETERMCTMLYTTSDFGGPTLGRVDFSIHVDSPAVEVHNFSLFEGQAVYGRVGLAGAGPDWLRALAGRHSIEFGSEFDSVLDPVRPVPTLLDEWPLGLGADGDEHRLVMPLAVECGNAVVQWGEECDDGNLELGDGCGMCMLEPDVVGGTDTGDVEEPSIEGASCSIDAGGHGAAELPLGLLLLAGLRRSKAAATSGRF